MIESRTLLAKSGLLPPDWEGPDGLFPTPTPSDDLRDRYRGCVLAGAAGDALGRPRLLAQESGAGGFKITLTGFDLPAGKAITLGLVGQIGATPGPRGGFSLNAVACDVGPPLGDPLPPTTGVTAPPTDLDAPHSPPAPPPGFPPLPPPTTR